MDPNNAYVAARSLVPSILKSVLAEALALVPATYDEAIVRYGVPTASFDPYGG